MRARTLPRSAILALLLAAAPAAAEEPRFSAPHLRLIPVLDGIREGAPEGNPDRVGETPVGKYAAAAGLDLLADPAALAAATRKGDRLFYVFWKTTEEAFGDRPYLIQRIKKTERTWTGAGDPVERITYQVEVFKTIAGTLKRADQHYGSFSLRDANRREIVKEYEIGFGEVPEHCEGNAWPYPATSLFRMLQSYQEERGLYDAVRFLASTKWTLSVAFDVEGAWRIASPELGLDLPEKPPTREAAAPKPNPASQEIVLEGGRGLANAKVGETKLAELRERFAPLLEDVEVGGGHRNLSTDTALTFNVDEDGLLNTIITRPGFAGRTKEGVAHGLGRAKVMELLGPPKDQPADAVPWRYPGLLVTFDAFGEVSRLVVFRR